MLAAPLVRFAGPHALLDFLRFGRGAGIVLHWRFLLLRPVALEGVLPAPATVLHSAQNHLHFV